jgi:rhodanese-related sulfurtransferase
LPHCQRHGRVLPSRRGLNAALEQLEAARKGNDYANVQALSEKLAFNGSGHVLHTLFWHSMSPDKTGDVVVYCDSRRCLTSQVAAEELEELGYRDVFVYAEGKAGWKDVGLPLVQ